jgi:hypothetical protein
MIRNSLILYEFPKFNTRLLETKTPTISMAGDMEEKNPKTETKTNQSRSHYLQSLVWRR